MVKIPSDSSVQYWTILSKRIKLTHDINIITGNSIKILLLLLSQYTFPQSKYIEFFITRFTTIVSLLLLGFLIRSGLFDATDKKFLSVFLFIDLSESPIGINHPLFQEKLPHYDKWDVTIQMDPAEVVCISN